MSARWHAVGRGRGPWTPTGGRQGLSLLELLIVLGLIAAAIVPMMLALTPSLRLAEEEERLTVLANSARGTLERLADLEYALLAANVTNQVDLSLLLDSAAEEERVTWKGSSRLPAVSIADAAGSTGGLIEIAVQLDDIRFSTLKSVW